MARTTLTLGTLILLLASQAVPPINAQNSTTEAASASTVNSNSSSSSTSINPTTTTTTAPPPSSCSIVNNAIATGNFTFTVSPDVLSSNTAYTVIVSGSGNATVILQAKAGGSFVGKWSNGNDTCSGGSPWFNILFDANTTLVAQWTSTTNLSAVEMSAFIKVNDTYKLSKMLNPASTAAPATTKNSGTAYKPVGWCFDLARSLIVLLITTKLLL